MQHKKRRRGCQKASTKPFFPNFQNFFIMKKLIFLSLSILIISFLGSCKKDPVTLPTVINGQVLEQGSNKPIEGVKVVLMEGTYGGLGSGTYNYYPVDTILTDKDGKYSYQNPTVKSSKDYVLWFYKDQYFEITDTQDEVNVETNKTINPVTKMFPFAWLSIRVINDKPFDAGDKLEVGGEWTTGQYDRFQGANVNTIFIKKIKGGKKTDIVWWIIKNNIIKSLSDSIYVKPLDTTYYQIKY